MERRKVDNSKQASVNVSPTVQDKKRVEEKPITREHKILALDKYSIGVKSDCVLGDPGSCKIYCAKYDWDDKYIAAACDNGEIQVFNVKNQKCSYVMYSSRQGVPFSYVKWRPKNSYKAKNVFLSVNAEGEIQHWHLTSGKCLSTIKHDAFDPQLYCLDFNYDSSKIAVSGSESVIRIYDEEKRVLDMQLTGEGTNTPGHSSRVYCVRYTKNDPDSLENNPNLLLSGGWDYRVIIWDVREGKPVRSYFGPMICGDGIDVCDNLILTASWTQTNQLQTWDLREGDEKRNKPVTTIDWDTNMKNSNEPIFLYAGQFSKVDGALILAGGSNANEAKVFDRDNFYKCICNITELPREVDTVDFAHNSNDFLVAGGDGLLRVHSVTFNS